jgi:3-hydroxyacyl-CoA dehydrogenase
VHAPCTWLTSVRAAHVNYAPCWQARTVTRACAYTLALTVNAAIATVYSYDVCTGGPFRMLDSKGIDKYCAMMQTFAEKYGEQFEPCQLMKDMAASNKKFHSS